MVDVLIYLEGILHVFPLIDTILSLLEASDRVLLFMLGASRWATLGLSVVAFIGLTNLNLQGPGITSTVKSLWKGPQQKQQPEST